VAEQERVARAGSRPEPMKPPARLVRSGRGLFRIYPVRVRVAFVIAIVLTLSWYAVRGTYYRWLLGRVEKVDVTVLCDTSAFDRKPDAAVLLYDRLAMAPTSLALGLFQNRSPDTVLTYHFVNWPVDSMTADAFWLSGVPVGPLMKILFRDGETNYFVNVRERTIHSGRLVVRARWPGGMLPAPITVSARGGAGPE
jgi:hypothetical protein